MTAKITRVEWHALNAPFNLSDAHTHQYLNEDQERRIRDRLPNIYTYAEQSNQHDLESETYQRYLTLAAQNVAISLAPLVCYSASMAMEVVANLARTAGARVALVEPCFDNIPDILKRHGIPLFPISADLYDDPHRLVQEAIRAEASALMLVIPNNPTGHAMSESALMYIAEECHRHGIAIWLDACFRLYDSRICAYDQYATLMSSGVSFIVIEDTGKVWPTLDQKVSFIVSSDDLRVDLLSIHDDFLLNVSPFSLALVTAFCDYSTEVQFNDFRSIIDSNRAHFRAWVHEFLPTWESYRADSQISVEFGSYRREAVSPDWAVQKARTAGVAVLPGRSFYWADQREGEWFVRFALARDPRYFQDALRSLGQELMM